MRHAQHKNIVYTHLFEFYILMLRTYQSTQQVLNKCLLNKEEKVKMNECFADILQPVAFLNVMTTVTIL